MRSGTVCLYLGLAAITLLPGLLLRISPDAVLGWPRADAWLLYDQRSPSAAFGRALIHGSLYDEGGRLVGEVVQQGLLRNR